MNIHRTGIALICALVLGLSIPTMGRADDPKAAPPPAAPHGGAPSCEKLMDSAMSMLLEMPAGVEKTAAQQELTSAQVDRQKGDVAGCRTHVNNAVGAMKAHNPG
jgi:hypothetical protein